MGNLVGLFVGERVGGSEGACVGNEVVGVPVGGEVVGVRVGESVALEGRFVGDEEGKN